MENTYSIKDQVAWDRFGLNSLIKWHALTKIDEDSVHNFVTTSLFFIASNTAFPIQITILQLCQIEWSENGELSVEKMFEIYL